MEPDEYVLGAEFVPIVEAKRLDLDAGQPGFLDAAVARTLYVSSSLSRGLSKTLDWSPGRPSSRVGRPLHNRHSRAGGNPGVGYPARKSTHLHDICLPQRELRKKSPSTGGNCSELR